MIKYTRLFFIILLAFFVSQAKAQSTAATSSPYSRFGIGELSDQLLPQNIGMGGISTAINSISGYNNINFLNPASYGKINFTVIDAGVFSDINTLSKSGIPSERDVNTTFSHVLLAVPITHSSALSFGLTPYSQMGYNYKQILPNGFGTTPTPSNSPKVDTNAVNYIYQGDGGLSKAYMGYGVTIAKHLMIGANVSYIFGDIKQSQSTEVPLLYGTLDSKIEQDNHVKGFNYDYGVQYSIDFSATKHLVLGYSGSASSNLSVKTDSMVSQYYRDASGNINVASDTLQSSTTPSGKLHLPQINRFGISFQADNRFLVGVDYTIGKWSGLSINGSKYPGIQDSRQLNVGGQITPNINALSSFWALIDYRLGFIYEDTYLNVNNTNIKRYAGTFGLGIPLPHDRASTAFYKINFSAEIGQQGTTTNSLVKENYINFHLGFTLNDKWFQRYHFE